MNIRWDSSREYDLILVGRAAIDFNPKDYFQKLSDCTTFIKYLGGSPANIAVGLSRLGKKCGFITRTSDDAFGDFVLSEFKKEGVDISQIRRCEKGEKTGLTFTEILSADESSILMYRDKIADLSLKSEDIDENYIKKGRSLLISGTALAQSPSREAALKAVMLAEKTNTPIIFDIDFRPYNWVNADETAVYYNTVAEKASVILGSREEYDLTGAFWREMTDAEIAGFWQGKKAEMVVIKHGKKGSTAYTKDGVCYSVKPFPIRSLKSFGGGDGYASAFIFGLLEGWPIADCLELGSASASLMVASHGCSPFMPTLDKIQNFINECKAEFGEMIVKDLD